MLRPIRAAALWFALIAGPAAAETVLFVGNSFTFGAGSPVWRYRAGSVTDLNGDGVGGVPALFKLFTEEAGLDWRVSLETSPGKDLRWHWENRRALIDRAWDHVVLQDYSTLDRERPGNAAELVAYAPRIADMLVCKQDGVQVSLMATWSRPDLTYRAPSPWTGRNIDAMAQDLRSAYDRAAAGHPAIRRVLPVGQAFGRAIAAGVADADPYDGIAFGQVGLWTHDHYHASAHGYYLEALVAFGALTGRDPRTLGRNETGAAELGIAPDTAARLQQVAWETLASEDAPRSPR